MNIFGALDRLRQRLKEGAHDPIARWGVTYQGAYEAVGSRIIGTVADCSGNNRYPPICVVVTRDGDSIGVSNELVPMSNGWTFEIDCDSPFTPNDILKERLTVCAVDRVGARYNLKVNGAVQLGFVKEVTSPTETELFIDFSNKGNSAQYRLKGWHGQEPEHIWTDGKVSELSIGFDKPGTRYKLELLAWPFTVPDKLPAQTLIISLGDARVEKLHIRPGLNFLECDISPELTASPRATLRFDLPDAARSADLVPGGGERVLAVAFRRVVLKRYLPTKVDPFAGNLS
jgi:hypothetical protein